MSESLILDSLEIRNFRGFRHLRIGRLGRVNLIAGKNNVGKTCLLEALRLYASRGIPPLVWELLSIRGEVGPATEEDFAEQITALKYLFHGRKSITSHLEPIQVSSANSQADEFSIRMIWLSERAKEGGDGVWRLLAPGEYDPTISQSPGLVLKLGENEYSYPLDRAMVSSSHLRFPSPFKSKPYFFVPANGLGAEQISRWWDDIALTDLQNDVLDSLRIIEQGVEGVAVRSSPERGQERIPIVRVTGLDEPIPLRSLGEGMNRLFGIALALVNAKDGLLLIDEIDSGLHYSVQPDLWRLVFQVARRLNVQVFATTHSWDCIEGFQQAANEDEHAEGLLISLREKRGEIEAVLFSEQELAIATREQIEVR